MDIRRLLLSTDIATGALRATKLDGDVFAYGEVGPIPDVATEYAFGKLLVDDPKLVEVHLLDQGVEAPTYRGTVSRTSIILRAATGSSGTYAAYSVWV